MLDLGKCQCGCGEDLRGVNGNKKYVNGAHAARASRRRAAESGSATATREIKSRGPRTKVMDLGKCQCGCGEDLRGVTVSKKYVNGAHVARAYKTRKAEKSETISLA